MTTAPWYVVSTGTMSASPSTWTLSGTASTGTLSGSTSTVTLSGSASTGTLSGTASTGTLSGPASTGTLSWSASTGTLSWSASTGTLSGTASTGTRAYASAVLSFVATARTCPIGAISWKRPHWHTADSVGARHTGGSIVGLSIAFGRRHTFAIPRRTQLVFGYAAAETGVVAAADEDVAGEVTTGGSRTRAADVLTLRRV